MFITLSFGQKKATAEFFKDSINKWTFEVYAGQSKGLRPYSEGYFSSNPNKYFGDFKINHYNLGARYMISPKFGMKFDYAFDRVYNSPNTDSKPFNVHSHALSFQSVVNLARILELEEYIGRFGVLVHGGMVVSVLLPKYGVNKGLSEFNGGFIFGATPQYKISKQFSILTDLSFTHNIRQHFSWDGSYSPEKNNLTGQLVSVSIGVSYSIGVSKEHGDWATIPDESTKLIEPLDKRISDMETLMNDTDKDGVPDYLDSENNTITGVAVDTKGRAVDYNNNGVPDELESYIDLKYNNMNNTFKEGDNSYTNSQMKTMINGGYVNVFFDFDKSNLTPGTLSSVNFLIKYLKTNTSSKCDVIGYADGLGDSNYNLALAKTRATNVREIIIKSGISADRINLIVNGVDNSIPKDSKLARQLERRVGFKVD